MPRDLDLTFDISTGALTLDRVVGNYVKRSETLTLSVTIVSNGASATIPAGLVGTLKPVNTYGTTLAQWTTFSQVGATNVYTAATTINAAAVTTLLGTTTEQANCVFDFAGAGVVESDTLALVLKNNVTRDTDTAPTALLERNDFLVTNGTGLLVNVAAGYAANGAFVAAQSSLAITNATNYIEVSAAGVASVNTTAFTAGSYPLATVVASAGAITANTDLRAWITPKPATSTGLTVGTTAIASGTSGRILYDNAGVLGELPVGTGVATALAVNVGSAGAFLTSAVTSITGTANEITVTGTTTPTLSLPSALTFTSKTVTGGTFTGGAFNGTVGATTPSTIAGTTGTFSGTIATTQANGFISTAGANALIFTDGASAKIFTTGESSDIFTTGQFAKIYTTGVEASIYTTAANSPIYTVGAGSYIQTRSTFNLFDGTRTTAISHAPTDSRNIALPDASGTLALTTDITGGTLAGSFTTLTASATTSLLLGTAGSAVGNIGFRNATSGTTTLQPATGALGTGTVTLPLSGTLAISSGAQTFTGVQSMTSPDITTSITTPSTTFAIANATATTLNIGGAATTIAMGAAGAGTMNIPLTTSAASATTGALTIGNGTAATNVGIGGGKIHAGGTITANGAITSSGTITGSTLAAGSSYLADMELRLGGSGTAYLRVAGATNAFQVGQNHATVASSGTLKAHDVTTGTGASMTIAGGTGSVAGGAVILATRTTTGAAVARITCGADGSTSVSGTLAVTGASTLTGLLTANGGITLGDAQNIAFNTTTGTKIGAATTQKLSFWNATPIVQPTTAVASATVASPGGGVNLKTDDTFDGYTIAQVVKALRNAGLLA
jgi:hypothetical protein